MFVEKCEKEMVDKPTLIPSFHSKNRKWRQIKKVVFIDGKKQKRRFSIRTNGPVRMIITISVLSVNYQIQIIIKSSLLKFYFLSIFFLSFKIIE